MGSPKTDRRSRERVPARIAASVKHNTQTHPAITRDLSMNGVFLYADEPFAEGSNIEIILILPEELGLGDKQWACCHASVVRVEEAGKRFGVAAAIDRLVVLPEIPG